MTCYTEISDELIIYIVIIYNVPVGMDFPPVSQECSHV